VSYVGSFFSYVNDARSHEPEVKKKLNKMLQSNSFLVRDYLAY